MTIAEGEKIDDDERFRRTREAVRRAIESKKWRKPKPEEVEKRVQKALETAIDSDTFTPTGETLGIGCWGVVEEYEDPTGQKWALKRFSPNEIAKKQMLERNLTPEDVMRKEAVPLSAAQHNVAPRIIERDKNGELFVGMPVYKKTLEERLRTQRRNEAHSLGERVRYLPKRDQGGKTDKIRKEQIKERLSGALGTFKDVVEAISYLHYTENRAHGDIKPKNILLDERGRAFLTDLGSSTCISIANEDPRDNIGDANYRAPECYQEDSRPNSRSDVWSAGALLYELVTGDKVKRGCKDLHELTEREANKILRKKIRKAPRKVRKLLRKCLEIDSIKRHDCGTELKEDLEKVIRSLDGWNVFKDRLKITGLAAIPAVFLGVCIYGATTYEPQKLEMPTINKKVEGVLYKPGSEKDIGELEFEAEQFPLPEPMGGGLTISGLTKLAKNSTENRIVAYFTKTHGQAAFSGGRGSPRYTDNQYETFMAYTSPDERNMLNLRSGPVWPIWAKSIEVALNYSKTKDGKVDLEDVMANTRVGPAKVSEAQRISGSFDYQDYRHAKDTTGDYIIPKEEQRFIETWLSQFHADVD